MATFKVNVDKLNLRRSPVQDFNDKINVVGVLHKDALFESVGRLENELGGWQVGADGNCVSEKWLKTLDEDFTKQLREVDYSSFVSNLDFDWLKSAGRNITIVLIDTGIVANNNYYSQYKVEEISSNNMNSSHGNFIGGIIAGQKKIIGLTKECNLLSIKYKSNGDPLAMQLDNFIKGLNIVLNLVEPQIINISQGFNLNKLNEKFPQEKESIIALIKEISSQSNKLIFCAADDNSAINDTLFPANMEECISIGCIDEFSKDLPIEVKLNILTPMQNFTSFDNEFNQSQDSGSSFSTAIVSSLAACFLAEKRSISKEIFLNELERLSVNTISFTYGTKSLFQYHILQ